jgi:hypothetical protein
MAVRRPRWLGVALGAARDPSRLVPVGVRHEDVEVVRGWPRPAVERDPAAVWPPRSSLGGVLVCDPLHAAAVRADEVDLRASAAALAPERDRPRERALSAACALVTSLAGARAARHQGDRACHCPTGAPHLVLLSEGSTTTGRPWFPAAPGARGRRVDAPRLPPSRWRVTEPSGWPVRGGWGRSAGPEAPS